MTDLTRVGERGKLKPLPGKRPHFQRLRQGVFVGYRPPVTGEGPGTWVARARDEIAGNYRDKSLGDYGKLAGSEMFAAAKRDTEAFAIQVETGGMPDVTIVTVADACRAYDAKGNDKSTLNRLVFNDPIGMVRLDRLRRQHLREWRSRLTGKPSTINRAMVPLRAALGAVKEPGRPGTDAAWQEALKPAPRGAVKPEERKREYLPVEDRRALAKLTPLVKALTLLPVRPGALAALRVKDFDKRTGMLTIPKDKAGAGRTIADCLGEYLKRPDRNDERLLDYAEELDNGAVFKRLGYLLERQESAAWLVKECRARLTKGNAKLDPALDCPRLVTRWRLQIPEHWAQRDRS